MWAAFRRRSDKSSFMEVVFLYQFSYRCYHDASLRFLFHPRQGELRTGTIREKLGQFDFVSLPFLFPGIISTLLGLQWDGSAYPWRI